MNSTFSTLFETMLIDHGKIPLLSYHYERISTSIFKLNWPPQIESNDFESWWNHFFSSEKIKNSNKILRAKISIGLKHNSELDFLFQANEFIMPTFPLNIAFHPKAVRSSDDPFYQHKWNDRRCYDLCIKTPLSVVDDFIFVNEKNEVCETSRHNIYCQFEDRIFTPPLTTNILPGVMRASLLKNKKVEERILYPKDFYQAEKLFISNALIGLQPARLIQF